MTADVLAEHGFVEKHRAEKNNYFICVRLAILLTAGPEER
jgi:hypothetical protein